MRRPQPEQRPQTAGPSLSGLSPAPPPRRLVMNDEHLTLTGADRDSGRAGDCRVRREAGLVEVTMHTARCSHSRLAAYHVILEALVRGDAVARELPRGYAKLADQRSPRRRFTASCQKRAARCTAALKSAISRSSKCCLLLSAHSSEATLLGSRSSSDDLQHSSALPPRSARSQFDTAA